MNTIKSSTAKLSNYLMLASASCLDEYVSTALPEFSPEADLTRLMSDTGAAFEK